MLYKEIVEKIEYFEKNQKKGYCLIIQDCKEDKLHKFCTTYGNMELLFSLITKHDVLIKRVSKLKNLDDYMGLFNFKMNHKFGFIIEDYYVEEEDNEELEDEEINDICPICGGGGCVNCQSEFFIDFPINKKRLI